MSALEIFVTLFVLLALLPLKAQLLTEVKKNCCDAGVVHYYLGNNCDIINGTNGKLDRLESHICLMAQKSCCLQMKEQSIWRKFSMEMFDNENIVSYASMYIEYHHDQTERKLLIDSLAKKQICEHKVNIEKLYCVNCYVGLMVALNEIVSWDKQTMADRFASPNVTSVCDSSKEQFVPYKDCCLGTLKMLNRTIKWCNVKPAFCAHKCHEVQSNNKRFECTCYEGYKLDSNGRDCVDVDECEEHTHKCDFTYEKCVNTEGGFQCIPLLNSAMVSPVSMPKCQEGYYYNVTQGRCKDIDECHFGLHNCDMQRQVCRNMLGTFACLDVRNECPSGFKKINSTVGYKQIKCIDIDECAEKSFDCDVKHEDCENFIGSYTCEMKVNTTSHHNMKITKNETTETIVCGKGQRFNRFSFSCDDINECAIGQHGCDLTKQKCLNFQGTYACVPLAVDRNKPARMNHLEQVVCGRGYLANEVNGTCDDLNECVTLPCPPNAYCQNTIGSFICHCKAGYAKNNRTNQCDDIDECSQGIHNCLSNLKCYNKPGSYDCDYAGRRNQVELHANAAVGHEMLSEPNCEKDQIFDSVQRRCIHNEASREILEKDRVVNCVANERIVDGKCEKIICGTGFIYNQTQKRCQDLNECLMHFPCTSNQKCTNTIGSYRCTVQCEKGYVSSFHGDDCLDVDECSERLHNCAHDKECINKPGGFQCQCPKGYFEYRDGTCRDIDECEQGDRAVCTDWPASKCINTVGSYQCQCREGYHFIQVSNGEKRCVDVDECRHSNKNNCSHWCHNLEGSYRCSCHTGYTLSSDGHTCVDVDECQTFTSNDSNSITLNDEKNSDRNSLCYYRCHNVPGSFKCICPPGYESIFDGRHCKDIDECETESVCTGGDEYCLNVRGSYRCQVITCPKGYHLYEDSQKCVRPLDGVFGYRDVEKPSFFMYKFISIVSNINIPKPEGYLDLIGISGPVFHVNGVKFNMSINKASTGVQGLQKASLDNFILRRTNFNRAVVALVTPLHGPQDVELELTTSLYADSQLGGVFKTILNIVVSEFSF